MCRDTQEIENAVGTLWTGKAAAAAAAAAAKSEVTVSPKSGVGLGHWKGFYPLAFCTLVL